MMCVAVFLLSGCSKKTNITNAQSNQSTTSGIHPSCFDPMGKKKFVKGLIASRSYNDDRKFYSPIYSPTKTKLGFIKADFNHDGLSDFIFLERNPLKDSAQLMTCISKKQLFNRITYQREETLYVIREYKKLTNYVESTQVKLAGDKLSIQYSNHAHNDGGDGNTSIYKYNAKLQDFILVKYQYSAYGEVFPEISQEFDLINKRYREETGCSFATNPSAMGYDPNCKPQKLNQCLSNGKLISIRNSVNRENLKKRVISCK